MSTKKEILEYINEEYEQTGNLIGRRDLQEEFGLCKSYANKILKEFRENIVYTLEVDDEELFEDTVYEAEEDEKKEEVTDGDKVTSVYDKDSATVNVNSFTIHTLEQAIDIGKVDLNVWEVERYIQNSWEVTMKDNSGNPIKRTNYQIKLFLKRKVNHIQEGIKDLFKNLDDIQLNFTVNPSIVKSDFAGEIALYDAHFGKLGWHKETMMGNWDTEICKKAYLEGCEKGLAHLVPYNPAKIFFIFGNDFMHFENNNAKTPMGNHDLDVDARLPKVVRSAMQAVIEAINMCRSVAPVDVKWIPGNHDLHVSYFLSLMLEAYYKNDKFVNIDNSESSKKAELWGNLLVGWLHDASGRKENASINLLPQLWPKLWGQSIFRELHTGHKHKKAEMKTRPTDTVGGTIIRQIPSLSSIDYWHSDNIFVDAVPAGESLLWSKDNGVVGHFTVNIKPSI